MKILINNRYYCELSAEETLSWKTFQYLKEQAYEGIDAPSDILSVANSNEDYANKVLKLQKDDNFNNEISSKSRKFIVNNFSWEKVFNDFCCYF